ncbi:hypothetical protein SLS62_006914 [Diatrype stigma]|uniref:Phospholipid-binding protein n=1 Tax=Diatrype stigma TaxID=117547 RepID=A0AAN9YR68_9PEZI
MAASHHERLASPEPSQLPPIPNSPTYSYASTANRLSAYNLPPPPPPKPTHAVLTKADLEQSQQAYSDLLATAKSYRVALAALSTAASAFGSALEACARLKESRAESLIHTGGGGGGARGPGAPPPLGHHSSYASTTATTGNKGAGGGPPPQSSSSCTADLILGASGVHHLIANHQQILSETVYRSFEVPLLHELDAWRRSVDDEEEAYRSEAAARSREIRRLEKEGLKLHRQRRRDVGVLREHLVQLTARLDGLTALHADHARSLLRDSQDASARILDASCSLVRAEVDIFESLARKGWSGGGLDDLLEKGRDLFAAEDDDLPPPGILLMGNGGGGGGGIGIGGGGGGGGGHQGMMVTTAGGIAAIAGGGTGGAGTRAGTPAAAAAVAAAEGGGGAKLFSILPPKSILADTSPDRSRPLGGDSPGRSAGNQHEPGRADSLLVDDDDVGERYQSLAGAVGEREERERQRSRDDNESIFSDLNLSQARRPIRPFSPQPIRRHATDVIMDPDSLLSDDEFEIGVHRARLGGGSGGGGGFGGGKRDVSAQALGLDLDDDDVDDDDDDDDDDGGRHNDDKTNDGDDDDEDDGEDAETISPWKNEGITRRRSRSADAVADESGNENSSAGARRPTSSDRSAGDGGGGGGGGLDVDVDVDSSTAEERERRWGSTDADNED